MGLTDQAYSVSCKGPILKKLACDLNRSVATTNVCGSRDVVTTEKVRGSTTYRWKVSGVENDDCVTVKTCDRSRKTLR